jgi:hypothetical protein
VGISESKRMSNDIIQSTWNGGMVGLLERASASMLGSLAARITAGERQRDLLLKETSDIVALVTQLAIHVRKLWRSVCDEVAASRTPFAHDLRTTLAQATANSLRTSREVIPLLDRVTKLTAHELSGVKEMQEVVAWVEKFDKVVLPAWTGPDELEELAGEHYPLSSAELDVIGAKHPAPTVWAEQEGNPC